jgi:hypothetical protein
MIYLTEFSAQLFKKDSNLVVILISNHCQIKQIHGNKCNIILMKFQDV